MRPVLLTLCVTLALALTVTEAGWGGWGGWYRLRYNRVVYTIENKLNTTAVEDWFSYTVLLYAKKTDKFFDVMNQAAQVNDHFQFNYTTYSGLGAFITCINNLCQDDTNDLYWGFIRRANDGSDCLLPVGVSTYVPKDYEQIVFSYITLAMFSTIPQCGGGSHAG